MSTSLLYHGFGIRGYQYTGTRYQGGGIFFKICRLAAKLVCPGCGSREVIRRGTFPRRFLSVPMGGKPVWICLPVQRVGCRQCGELRQDRVDFAEGKKRYTSAFERYALELLHHATIKDVAQSRPVGTA